MFRRITLFFPLLLVMISGIAYAAPGDLDTTFNPPYGFVTYDGGIRRDWGSAVAIQPDGKIVVAGGSYTTPRPYDVLILRYNADGSPDKSFGTNGVVTYDGGNRDWGWAMAIQPDGKIVITGFTDILGPRRDRDLLVLRYNADGLLDSSFGANGIVTYDVGNGNEYGRAVAIQSDGKIVVAGGTGTVSYGDLLVLRYNADGSFDSSFGTNGVATYRGTGNDYAWAAAIQSDGKIIVAGESSNGSDQDVLVLRYNADGSLDKSFGTDGISTYDGGSGHDFAESVAIQSDGKIVVGGWGERWVGLLFRYKADGSLDKSFGTDGVITYYEEGYYGVFETVAIQSDGKIVAAGATYNGTDLDVWVVRFKTDGSLDYRFGTNGVATYDSGARSEWTWGVAIQPDGMIVVAGEGNNGSNYDVLVLRLIGGGSEPIPAFIDIKPDTLNTKSKGKWITCYIELSDGYSVEDIDFVTLTQFNSYPIDPFLATVGPSEIGDHDDDGIPDLMVKFDRQELIPLLEVGDAELTIAGELGDGTPFEGSDTIRVIRPGK